MLYGSPAPGWWGPGCVICWLLGTACLPGTSVVRRSRTWCRASTCTGAGRAAWPPRLGRPRAEEVGRAEVVDVLEPRRPRPPSATPPGAARGVVPAAARWRQVRSGLDEP